MGEAPGPEVRTDSLDVRIAAALDIEVVQGKLVSRTGMDVRDLATLFAGAKVQPLVRDVPRAQLDAWYAHACEVLPVGRRPGHLGHWLRIEAASAAVAQRILGELLHDPRVDHAYLTPIVRPASQRTPPAPLLPGDPAPPTPSFMGLQLNLGPSPSGLGVRIGNGVLGARGQGVRVVMVEDDWILDHEDVSKLTAANFLGTVAPQTSGSTQHGLSGTSILCADRNEWGLTGIADEIDIKFNSRQFGLSLENSLAVAVANTQQGDVIMMILMFLLGQLGIDDWVPVEYLQGTFDAVLTATANGRIVVSAGGNGGRSLDDPRLLRRFDRGFRDSGAIMVGASDGANAARASWCNFGSRIDANGWGEHVVCAGYGDLFFGNSDVRQAYTGAGTGTSSATPQVAGVVCAVQGAARRQLGRSLTAPEMLTLLHEEGAASPDSIGRRPDLVSILHAIGAADGLQPAEPDIALGGSVAVTMTGAGGGAFLFASFGVGNLDLGFNRRFHLDLSRLQTVGFFAFVNGQASWTLNVPTNAALHGVSLYLQSGELGTNGSVHLANSAQISVL